jgi:uncharacterized protein
MDVWWRHDRASQEMPLWRVDDRSFMLHTYPAILFALLSVIVLGFAKGGFAGLGALATPLMALAVTPIEAAAILLPILLIQDPVSVWSFRKSWNARIIAWMLPGALLGVFLGWAVAARLTVPVILAMLGAITTGFGIWRSWIECRTTDPVPSRLPDWLGTVFGVATGFTSQIAHAGGPPFQMWVAPKRLPHTEYAGTNVVLFAAINWAKVPAYWSLGQFKMVTLWTSVMLMPVAILSTFAGVCLVKRINGPLFYRIINGLMILLGARLLWEGLGAL